MAKKIIEKQVVKKAVRTPPKTPSQAIKSLQNAGLPGKKKGLRPAPTKKEEGAEEQDDDFDRTREVTDRSFDISEQVMAEIEAELFRKEETVREELKEVHEASPDKIETMLETASKLQGKELHDFVTAAETLYKGKEEELPGDQDKWKELKEKAKEGVVEVKARPEEKAEGKDASKAEQYARRERAIEVFRRTIFGGEPKEVKKKGLMDRTKADSTSEVHFFGPSIGDESVLSKGTHDLRRVLGRMGRENKSTPAAIPVETETDEPREVSRLSAATDKVGERDQVIKEMEEKVETATEEARIDDKKVRQLEAELKGLTTRLEEKDRRILELEEGLKSAPDARAQEGIIGELKRTIGERESTIDSLKRDTAELSKRLKEIEAESSVSTDATRKEMEDLRAHISALKADLEEARTQAEGSDDLDRDMARKKVEIELKMKEIEKLETSYKRNHQALKQIARENLEKEIKINKQEVILEEFEKQLNLSRKEMEEERASFEKIQATIQTKREQLDGRENKLAAKEEDILQKKRELLRMKEEQEETLNALKEELREKKAIENRIEVRLEDVEKREARVAEIEKMVPSRSGHAKELDKERQHLERVKADLLKKEKELEEKMASAEAKRAGAASFEEELEKEGLTQRRTDLDRREEELRSLESTLKKRWAKIQIEAKKLSEERSMLIEKKEEAAAAAAARIRPVAVQKEPEEAAMKPLLKVRCIGCKKPIPIFSAKRPLKVECKNCGKVGILR